MTNFGPRRKPNIIIIWASPYRIRTEDRKGDHSHRYPTPPPSLQLLRFDLIFRNPNTSTQYGRISSRHISQTRNEYTSSSKAQKKFVPKTDFQKLITRQTTLSSSLRDDSAAADGGGCRDAEIASTGRVTMGENGEWVSKSSATFRFVIYLPRDEAVAAGLRADEVGLDPVESQHVVDFLNRSSNRDPGAKSADTLSPKDHTVNSWEE